MRRVEECKWVLLTEIGFFWSGTAEDDSAFTAGPFGERRNMAASVLCRRAAAFCRTLSGFPAPKTVLSANPRSGVILQTASYNPKPLKLSLTERYIPDKGSERTPEWQKTAKYDRKLFGRYGTSSGIDPASLWPTREQLDKIVAEENEWHPPLAVMLKNIEAREKELHQKRLAKSVLPCRKTLRQLSDSDSVPLSYAQNSFVCLFVCFLICFISHLGCLWDPNMDLFLSSVFPKSTM